MPPRTGRRLGLRLGCVLVAVDLFYQPLLCGNVGGHLRPDVRDARRLRVAGPRLALDVVAHEEREPPACELGEAGHQALAVLGKSRAGVREVL